MHTCWRRITEFVVVQNVECSKCQILNSQKTLCDVIIPKQMRTPFIYVCALNIRHFELEPQS